MRSKKGSALLLVLLTAAVVTGLAALVFTAANRDAQHAAADLSLVKAVTLAKGGVRLAKSAVAVGLRSPLESAAKSTATFNAEWFYGETSLTNPDQPDAGSVASMLAPVQDAMQTAADGIFCDQDFAPDEDSHLYVRVHFKAQACSKDLPPGVELGTPHYVSGPKGPGDTIVQTYALPFVAVVEAQVGRATRRYVSTGELRFSLGSPSFARYALFTNKHQSRSGSAVWFTTDIIYDGPVHTNEHFFFYQRPWFGGEVTSAGCFDAGPDDCQSSTGYGAFFHTRYWPYRVWVADTDMSPDPTAPVVRTSSGTHAPEFTAGVDWRADFVPMPQNLNDQRAKAQEAGIYIDQSALKVELAIDEGPPKYQEITVVTCDGPIYWGYCYGDEVTTRWRVSQTGLLEKYDPGTNTWVPENRGSGPVTFNGVIFSEGRIYSLEGPGRDADGDPIPAVADFAQIGVYAQYDIFIQSDLTYEDPPCSSYPVRNEDGSVTPAVCNNLDAKNVLGIYSQEGDVIIGTDAPNNVTIHAALMSARGQITVQDYDRPPYRGDARILGGLVQYFYGPFGTFGGYYGDTGYSRKIVYDPRFSQGITPPYYPTAKTAALVAISTLTYGTREQLY